MINGARIADWVGQTVALLVNDDLPVPITTAETDHTLVIELRPHDTTVGRVIGRNHENLRLLQELTRRIGAAAHVRVFLSVITQDGRVFRSDAPYDRSEGL